MNEENTRQEIVKQQARAYLGMLTLNGIERADPDLESALNFFVDFVIENYVENQQGIKLAIICATALDRFNDKLSFLKTEFESQKELLEKPTFERKYCI